MRRGISTFISLLLYLAIALSAIGIVLNVAFPLIERIQETGAVQNQIDTLSELDQQIRLVAGEGRQSSRTMTLSFRKGSIHFNRKTRNIYYEINTESPIISSHATKQIGQLTLSANADATVSRTRRNGTDCYLMENQHLEACIRSVPKDPIFSDSSGYWRMDGFDNATRADTTVNGNTGTVTGESFHHGTRGGLLASQGTDPEWTTGRQGTGLRFDGADDFVNATNDSATSLRSGFTIAAWIKPEADCSSNRMEVFHPTARWILRCEDRSEGGFGSPGNTFSPGIQLQLEVDGNWYNINTTIPTGEWSYVVGTYDNRTERLYVDGVLEDSYAVDGPVDEGGAVPHIGAHPSGNHFNGTIDEVRLWDRDLTPAEINVSMTGRFPPNRSVASYSFEAGTGQVVHDTHTRVQGRFRGGTSFDGGDDAVDISESDALPSGNEEYALAAWFNAEQDCSCGIVGWGNWGTANEATALRLHNSGGAENISLRHYWWSNDLDADTAVPYDGWHHVVAQFNGTHRSIWLDGERVAVDTPAGHDAVVQDATIGVTNNNEHFNGTLDAVQVYNRSLSAQEIRWEYLQRADDHYVNTSMMLVSLHDKETGRYLNGSLYTQVNGSRASRTGRGHTVAETGATLPAGETVLNLSGSGSGDYNVSYQLLSGSDFLTVTAAGDPVTTGIDHVLTSRAADDKYIDGVQRGEGVYTDQDIDYGAAVSEDLTLVSGVVGADGFQRVGFDNETSGGRYELNVTGRGETRFLVPFTQGTHEDVQGRERYITGGVFGDNGFFDFANPNFGGSLTTEKRVRVTLGYENILLDGFERSISPGTYDIVITNNGAADGKVNVSVKVQ